jgi:hypothetical protein
MRLITITVLALLLGVGMVQADLKPGDQLPNPTLTDKGGKEIPLHDMLNKVTVIHLWKCN